MREKAKIGKAIVCLGGRGKEVEVEGRVLPFTERIQEAIGEYANVQLFNYKRKWWLHYSYNSNTGYFTSRKKAAEWFNKSGR